MTSVAVPGGYAVNVEVSGTGAPLVLLHGFTGSARAWGEFGELLAAQFTLVAVDLPGHGLNEPSGDLQRYSMPQCGDDAVAAVRALGFETAHWLGYSMGGRTALHVAAAHPQALRSLVTIGASAGLDCIEDRIARRSADELLAARIEREGVPNFIDYWERIPLFASQRALPEAQRRAIHAGRLANHAAGLANSLRGMGAGAQEPLHGRLATLTMPALILAGELDEKYVMIGRELAAAMPAARFEAVPDAGHAAHTERPAAAAALAAGFIQSIELKAGGLTTK